MLACARIGAIHSVLLDFLPQQLQQELSTGLVRWLSPQMVDIVETKQ
jgi:acyl-coenzyme A synthetase/AMP-(fatty) acid ligase